MKIVLFDLGDTLESGGTLLPGALQTLETIRRIRDNDGRPLILALVSDYYMPRAPAELGAIRERYFKLLEVLGIRSYFEPVDERVTLSSEMGVFKPDERIFRRVLEKLGTDLRFEDVLFVTENGEHVAAARQLGMRAVHFQAPGAVDGEVGEQLDLIPRVEEFVNTPSPRALPRQHRETRLVKTRMPTDARLAWADPAAAVAAPWARFGNDLLLFTDAWDFSELTERSRRSADELEEVPMVARRECLHLVLQKGRLFQHRHPEVPILLDRGRYLVVDLDPDQARELGGVTAEGSPRSDEPCFEIRPLKDNETVFEEMPAGARRLARESWIAKLTDRISGDAFRSDLQRLVDFRTRHSLSADYARAAEWARELLACGYVTRLQSISVGGGASLNVIAERPGHATAARDVVLVTAHLDSVNSSGGADADAPGADDDGSGSAGVLQMARALEKHRSEHDLRFVLFGGEEQGLHGSKQYVTGLSATERSRIRAVVNMDMIGSRNVAAATVLLEGDARFRRMIEELTAAAHTYTSLTVETSLNPFASDHVSFLAEGIPAVLTIEGADSSNHRIHTADDTLDGIDVDFAVEVLRMNTAFVAGAVGRAE